MLTFDGVELRRGDFTLHADLAIAAGERVAVIGPSGAGKSTLLDAAAGFLTPDRGRILWQGEPMDPLPGSRPVSIVFQSQNLFPHMTAFQNVALGVDPRLRLSADQAGAVHAALDRVGLASFGSRKPARLSGGQRSRVALARVLVRHRPILLLDEPFAALGPALKAEMLDLVAELAVETGTTVLTVTHDPADARRFAPQTIVVADGIAAPPRPTEALLNDPPENLRIYLG